MALVEAENLCRSFGQVKALDGLNFSVEQGEIFGLMGPDGCRQDHLPPHPLRFDAAHER